MSDDPKKRHQAAMEKLARDLTDRGLLIEAGWMTFRGMVLPPDAGEDQLRDMRMAFFAGAQHLWGSMFTMMEPDKEPTPADERRMSQISDELNRFYQEMVTMLPFKGRA